VEQHRVAILRLACAAAAGRQLRVEGQQAPLADLIERCWSRTDPPSKEIFIPDRNGSRKTFLAEAWFNQRCLFVMVAEKRATRLGRRVRLASIAGN
jgi:hypothetical protein